MQVFPLIPFLLNISLSAELVGDFGPEYIFSVYVKISTGDNKLAYVNNFRVRTTLRCIPLELTLHCQLDKFLKTVPKMEPISKHDYVPVKPIHIVFDARGVKILYVPQNQDLFIKNVVRMIVGQLNTGVDLPTDYDDITNSFDANENSYICNCVSYVNIFRKNSDNIRMIYLYDLTSIPVLNLTWYDTVVIKRSRDLTRHPRDRGKYMFWSIEDYWLSITLTKSHSTMKISRNSFYSETVNAFEIMYDSDVQSYREIIKLKLAEVRPARTKGPSHDKARVGLVSINPAVLRESNLPIVIK